MFIEKLFKQQFPKISATAAEFLVSTAFKAEISFACSRALDRAHLGRDALTNQPAIEALASESDNYLDGYHMAHGVLYGAIIAFKKSGQIPEEYPAYEIRNFLEEKIGDFIREPIAQF